MSLLAVSVPLGTEPYSNASSIVSASGARTWRIGEVNRLDEKAVKLFEYRRCVVGLIVLLIADARDGHEAARGKPLQFSLHRPGA